jgi:membrane protein implicated in regulation of membrane protease activity
MTWSDGSQVILKIFSDKITRKIGLISYLLSGAGLIAGGIALLFDADWWQQTVIIPVVSSSIIIILLWNDWNQSSTNTARNRDIENSSRLK